MLDGQGEPSAGRLDGNNQGVQWRLVEQLTDSPVSLRVGHPGLADVDRLDLNRLQADRERIFKPLQRLVAGSRRLSSLMTRGGRRGVI